MASDPFLSWANRTVLRMGREEPYLSIQDIVVFVRDLEVSKRFYVEQLGFELLTEQCLPNGVRWIEGTEFTHRRNGAHLCNRPVYNSTLFTCPNRRTIL